jgi:hypothetical protein
MSGLTEKDMDILHTYAMNNNRERYWNYLAQHAGNDGYGLLALGVVRNDNMPGAVANIFAQNYAKENNHVVLNERGWEKFGNDLICEDFALRSDRFYRENRPDLALNLPAKDVQKAHEIAFSHEHISIDAWTPNRLLNAAERAGGEREMEKVWHQMLDNDARGVRRMGNTLVDIGSHYSDPELHAVKYTASMGLAYAQAAQSLPYSDPDRIGATSLYYEFDKREKAWYFVNDMAAADGVFMPQRETDPKKLAELNDARAVRLERNAKAEQIAPGDPYHNIAKSPFVLAQNTPESSELRTASIDGRAVAPSLYDELKSRLPPETSPERLAQITLAARQADIRPGQIGSISVQEATLHVIGQRPGDRISVDLATPPPAIQQTLQLAHAMDQQQAVAQNQTQQLAQAQSGPAMTMRIPGA